MEPTTWWLSTGFYSFTYLYQLWMSLSNCSLWWTNWKKELLDYSLRWTISLEFSFRYISLGSLQNSLLLNMTLVIIKRLLRWCTLGLCFNIFTFTSPFSFLWSYSVFTIAWIPKPRERRLRVINKRKIWSKVWRIKSKLQVMSRCPRSTKMLSTEFFHLCI